MDRIQIFRAKKIASSERREMRVNLAFYGSEKDLFYASVDLEGGMRAGERGESRNTLARERQAQDETKCKTGSSKTPKKTLTKSVSLSLPLGTHRGELPGQAAPDHCSFPPT